MNTSLLMLEDPISLRQIVADINFGAGGGWRVSISGYNFLYSSLKDDPKLFVGMVFRVKDPDNEDTYVRIIQGVHRWVKPTKKTDLPILEYLSVKYEVLGQDLLKAIELIEERRQKLEGDFKDETSTDESH